MSKLTDGLVAGAAGTAMINATTYLDMAIRGRPASGLPAQVVERVAARAGVSLGDDDQTVGARTSAFGALGGYVVGVTLGVAYAIASPLASRLPRSLAAVLVGGAALVATDAPSAALGATDLHTWSASAWLADAVPHLVYGAGVVLVHEVVSG